MTYDHLDDWYTPIVYEHKPEMKNHLNLKCTVYI